MELLCNLAFTTAREVGMIERYENFGFEMSFSCTEDSKVCVIFNSTTLIQKIITTEWLLCKNEGGWFFNIYWSDLDIEYFESKGIDLESSINTLYKIDDVDYGRYQRRYKQSN